MARPILDAQLQEIRNQVVHLGDLVEQSLQQSLEAVRTQDEARSGLVVASDTFIDETRREIERLSFESLTLQQPLGGRDLRFLTAVPVIAGDLERAGDNAVGIATLLLRILPLKGAAAGNVTIERKGQNDTSEQPLSESAIINGILELGNEAQRVLRETMQAFATMDGVTIRRIWQEDDVVDVRYHMVRHDLMDMLSGIHAVPALQQDERVLQRITYWLWIAHDLERIGDHCTNICERMLFIIEGETNIAPAHEV